MICASTLQFPLLIQMGATDRPPALDRSGKVWAIDDATLVERARGGDRRAEEQLFRRYGRLVTGTVTRLLGSRQDVDDVVQDAFLEAYDRLDQLREPAKFRAWLMRIAVMRVRKTIRRKRLKRSLGLENDKDDATLETLASSDITMEMRTQLAAVDAVLQELPTNQRVAWMLRYVEGRSLSEVAEMTDCSLATIKRRIKAAHDEISKVVQIQGEPDE